MLRDFIISQKLENAYFVNQFINVLRGLPIIGKHISTKAYGEESFKLLFAFINIIKMLFMTFIPKLLYILIAGLAFSLIINEDRFTSMQLLMALAITGPIFNSYLSQCKQMSYYAIKTMHLNPKHYAVSNYLFENIRNIIGQFIGVIAISFVAKINIISIFLFPLFTMAFKNIYNFYELNYYKKKKEFKKPSIVNGVYPILADIVLVGIFALSIFYTIPYLYLNIFMLVGILLGIPAFIYICKFDEYPGYYKKVLSEENFANVLLAKDGQKSQTVSLKKTTDSYLDNKIIVTSKKQGYEFFNDLFIKRHSKVLWSFSKNSSFIILVVSAAICFLLFMLNNEEVYSEIADIIRTKMHAFLLLMYFLNSGERITQAMFNNCDSAMLTYGFYRKKDVILKVFMSRLKSVVSINLIPSFCIGLGLNAIYFLCTKSLNIVPYLLLFFTIISMSIFFSIQRLGMYYIFQPYTRNSELKGGVYKAVSFITYFVSYYFTDIDINYSLLCPIIIGITILFTIGTLITIRTYAYKTFKIRL